MMTNTNTTVDGYKLLALAATRDSLDSADLGDDERMTRRDAMVALLATCTATERRALFAAG